MHQHLCSRKILKQIWIFKSKMIPIGQNCNLDIKQTLLYKFGMLDSTCTKLLWHVHSCGSSDEEDGEVGGLAVGEGGSSQGVSPGPSSDTDALSSVAPSPSPGNCAQYSIWKLRLRNSTFWITNSNSRKSKTRGENANFLQISVSQSPEQICLQDVIRY